MDFNDTPTTSQMSVQLRSSLQLIFLFFQTFNYLYFITPPHQPNSLAGAVYSSFTPEELTPVWWWGLRATCTQKCLWDSHNQGNIKKVTKWKESLCVPVFTSSLPSLKPFQDLRMKLIWQAFYFNNNGLPVGCLLFSEAPATYLESSLLLHMKHVLNIRDILWDEILWVYSLSVTDCPLLDIKQFNTHLSLYMHCRASEKDWQCTILLTPQKECQ